MSLERNAMAEFTHDLEDRLLDHAFRATPYAPPPSADNRKRGRAKMMATGNIVAELATEARAILAKERNDLCSNDRDRLERIRAALQAALAILDDELAAEALDGDRLITPKEGAFLLRVSHATIYRWQAAHPDELGVQRIGGKILLSQHLLITFARRWQPREK
jgi:hypothetical protein